MNEIALPSVLESTSIVLTNLTEALHVPRNVLASDEEIRYAWAGLPRVLSSVPAEFLSEQHAKMCVAVAAGLFDAAINYVWNSAIIELQKKVRRFGLQVVPQLINKPFDEKTLVELKDIQLLELCLSLNLIDEDGFFFLNQCREVRNNFSSAHPPIGSLDDHEFLSFLNRCAKYALSNTTNLKGVDTYSFIEAIKGSKFIIEQLSMWTDRLNQTHDAQRELLIGTLHGIYCDPESTEEARLNSLSICIKLSDKFTSTAKSILINRHNEYQAQGETSRHVASQNFFKKLRLLALLTHTERHTIVSRACARLLSVHEDFNNFYNEPPFAEQLAEISSQSAIPQTAQQEFVNTVMLCATGNQYGYSWAANSYYLRMIINFSPVEIGLMLECPNSYRRLSIRINSWAKCKSRFKELVRHIDIKSVPTTYKTLYESLVSE